MSSGLVSLDEADAVSMMSTCTAHQQLLLQFPKSRQRKNESEPDEGFITIREIQESLSRISGVVTLRSVG